MQAAPPASDNLMDLLDLGGDEELQAPKAAAPTAAGAQSLPSMAQVCRGLPRRQAQHPRMRVGRDVCARHAAGNRGDGGLSALALVAACLVRFAADARTLRVQPLPLLLLLLGV